MSDETELEEIRTRWDYASNEWQDIRDEARTDMLCIAGKPWQALDPAGVEQRLAAKRPMLALDELGQYVNQVTNDVRANPRGMKFSPVGNGANDKAAKFYEDKGREVEYRSHAQMAYTQAFEDAVTRSYGWVKVTTKHESIRSWNQDVWIEPIVNPDLIVPDPGFIRPDCSDIDYLFESELWNEKEFVKEFGKDAVHTTFDQELLRANNCTGWVKGSKIQVSAYWYREKVERTLLLLGLPPLGGRPQPPVTVLLDELEGGRVPPGVTVLKEETREDYVVRQCITNGLEILKKKAWAGRYIPFVSCFGKVMYVDEGAGAKRRIASMTRLARDPYLLYCYYRTCEAELVGMTPKFPYFAFEGQLEPDQLVLLQKSLHEPVAVILVKPMVDGAPGQLLGYPQRQPYEPPIQSLELGAEAARRAIQAAMGISPLPTEAQRHNQKSGKALERIEQSGQRGSFHFVDHFEDMVQQVGTIFENLCDKVYDTARETGVRQADGKAAMQVINTPGNPASIETKGDYLVTVSTGPSYDSERDAAGQFADTLIGTPEIAAVVGPQKMVKIVALAVKLKNVGPLGDQMAEIIDPSDEGQADPKRLQAELQQAKAFAQEAGQKVQQAVQVIQTKQVESQSRERIAAAQLASKERIEQARIASDDYNRQADREAKIAVAELGAKVDRIALFLEERARLGVQDHEAALAERDQAHEVGLEAHKAAIQQQLAAQAQQHALEQGDAEHGQALAQGDQAHQQALEQGEAEHEQGLEAGDAAHGQVLEQQQQAADLAPEPAEDDGA